MKKKWVKTTKNQSKITEKCKNFRQNWPISSIHDRFFIFFRNFWLIFCGFYSFSKKLFNHFFVIIDPFSVLFNHLNQIFTDFSMIFNNCFHILCQFLLIFQQFLLIFYFLHVLPYFFKFLYNFWWFSTIFLPWCKYIFT